MNELTLTKMKQMKLYGMHGAFKTAVETGKTDHYSIDQFVSMITDAEWDERHNRRIERIIKMQSFITNPALKASFSISHGIWNAISSYDLASANLLRKTRTS